MAKKRVAQKGIGTQNERSLHKAIKTWYAEEGDVFEVTLSSGYIADILRGNTVIEIQTRAFSKMKRKLDTLLPKHPVRLLYPVACEKHIVTVDDVGNELRRKRSPKRGKMYDVFRELISLAEYLPKRRFTVEVLLAEVEEVRCEDGLGSWRRKGVSVVDTRLVSVRERVTLGTKRGYMALLPKGLPKPFTNKELATHAKVRKDLAAKMTYTLEKAGYLSRAGKKGNAHLFTKA